MRTKPTLEDFSRCVDYCRDHLGILPDSPVFESSQHPVDGQMHTRYKINVSEHAERKSNDILPVIPIDSLGNEIRVVHIFYNGHGQDRVYSFN